jgi:C1A family cysteine protease
VTESELYEIKKAILESKAKWEAQETFIMKMPVEERRLLLGYTPGPDDPSSEVGESIAKANLAMFEASIAAAVEVTYPPSYDLRNVAGQNFITGIKDQGHCGSCVAFCVAATVEGTFRRQLTDPTFPADFSEAQLFYCYARSEGRRCFDPNGGWWPSNAFNFFRDRGVAEETCYPYTAGDQNCTNLCADWVHRASKLTAWHRIYSTTEMKEWISKRGPLSACFSVYADFFSYTGGIYRHVSGNFEGGHCASVVGYDDANRFWICKNSWGPNWGESGYFRIAYGEVGIDAFMDAVDGVGSLGWGGPESLTSGTWDTTWDTDPSAVSWGPGHLDIFGIGTDSALWHKWWDGARWNGPAWLGGRWSIYGVDAVSWGPYRIDVFGLGMDRALWHKWWDGSRWNGPESLGGRWTNTVNAVSMAPGYLDIFGIGTDSALWHKWNYGSGWGGPESLGGRWSSAPSAVSWAPGRLDVFGRGSDGALYHLWWGGTDWFGESLGGTWLTRPSAVSWGPGRLDVFGLGMDRALWHKWWDGSRWNGPESLGGTWASHTDAVSWGPGRLDIFSRGPTYPGALQHKWWDGSRWNGPESLGGTWTSTRPSAVSWGPGRLDIFSLGIGASLEHIWRG